MNYSLLRDEIKQIQQEYKNLLSNLLPLLKAKRSMVALDEINLFWARHIDIVKLYLKTELSVMNSYVFTAATYMDIEDKEQYPFLLLGDQHILDDPLCKYAEICIKMPDSMASELLYQQIVKAAEDDIRVINTCEDQIVILPLRLLNSPKEDNPLLNLGEQIFLSMFPDINSMETYVQKCSNFSDIVRYGIPNLSEIIMFSEDDNRATPFEERFRAAINNAPGMVDKTKSDAEKQNQNNLQEDNHIFKSRNPNILRFKINGYNILDSIQTVFISKPENDGSFLLTADRIYYVNQKQRKETVYVLFKAIGSNGSSTTFQIEPEIVQDVKNQNSFVYKMAQRNDLTAKKTGNLVVINNSDKNMQIDMLIDIDA